MHMGFYILLGQKIVASISDKMEATIFLWENEIK